MSRRKQLYLDILSLSSASFIHKFMSLLTGKKPISLDQELEQITASATTKGFVKKE
ncbi:MAG: hypothetical protein F6K40_31170 [Okeania sp. SIO3I5]|uniref:hypothetical protein n=1 Tax=Okeania sp. SIO3I5 TaxID=2607805 RepID=UPI0013BB3DE9|nr:hypothetical protein [Okeania sp. SIO3I5]NEQ40452.1 hypothetical protein [Okeania sp. SIO3I5]